MAKDQTLQEGNHHSDEQSADNNPKLHSSMSEKSCGYYTSEKKMLFAIIDNVSELLVS